MTTSEPTASQTGARASAGPPAASLRIGELARRAGIPASTLRAWERRYGIVKPARTESGYRLYSAADERRLRAMVELITQGLAPAEAAAQVVAAARTSAERAAPAGAQAEPAGDGFGALREELIERLRGFDEVGAHSVLDRALAAYGPENLVHELVLPTLRRTGELWEDGSVSVGQEHFGTLLIRGRILALGRGWSEGEGPLLLLACAPGERHDLPLVAFGLTMRRRGFRIALLGADTPLETLADTALRLRPARVVLSVTSGEPADGLAAARALQLGSPVAIGGAAATPELAGAVGAELLPAPMLDAAEHLAATVGA